MKQSGQQAHNINHVIRALLGPAVLIDWRDAKTLEVSLTGNFTELPDGTLTY